MNANELRALQAPFKDKYRDRPESARQQLHAQGRIDVETVTCQILRPGPPAERAGLHPLTGGNGSAACAAEMLLESLVGCAGVTFAAVCTALEIPVSKAQLAATGTVDFRGTLGVSREVPIGFQSIRVEFQILSESADEKLAKAVQLAERYCVVAQSLKAVEVSWSRLA